MTVEEANRPIAQGIIYLIKKNGIKQKFIAEKAGYKTQEFSDMLNGRKLIKACDIPKLAFALGVTSNEIYAAGEKMAEKEETE